MLAKEWKIRKLKEQGKFIKERLEGIFSKRDDGDLSFMYVGHIFSEVKEYFEKEGFTITQVENEQLSAKMHGLPMYLLIPNEQALILSEDELKQAEEYEPDETPEPQNPSDGSTDDDDPVAGFLGAIFGR